MRTWFSFGVIFTLTILLAYSFSLINRLDLVVQKSLKNYDACSAMNDRLANQLRIVQPIPYAK